MGEFVAYAKANPGKLEYGQGDGTTQVAAFPLPHTRGKEERQPRRESETYSRCRALAYIARASSRSARREASRL
jgi:hypothetical protein